MDGMGGVGGLEQGLVGIGGAEDEAPRALAFIIMKNCKPCSDQLRHIGEPGWWGGKGVESLGCRCGGVGFSGEGGGRVAMGKRTEHRET